MKLKVLLRKYKHTNEPNIRRIVWARYHGLVDVQLVELVTHLLPSGRNVNALYINTGNSSETGGFALELSNTGVDALLGTMLARLPDSDPLVFAWGLLEFAKLFGFNPVAVESAHKSRF